MSMIGLRVGPFEIEEAVEVPSPGAWYRARRTGMTRRQPEEVLVRLLPEDADGSQRASLQAAFHNLRAVEDPRIPAAVALYEGVGGLAIDVPDGVSLQEVITARGKGTIALTPATLLDLALELAETLQHAHHRNRHHGHLEPSVVRLTSTGKVFIFGFEDPEIMPSEPWISPERARGEACSGAADQWALAAMMAGLIAGVVPWDAEHTAVDGRTSHLVAPIEEQWPALARLIRRMLESDPGNRHPSMHPVRQELLALARKARGTSERLELGRTMVRRLGRRVAAQETAVASPPSNTSAETEVAPQPAPETDEAMNLPDSPPPPVVERVPPEQREPTPLVREDLAVVQPDVDGDAEVPRIRRGHEPPASLDEESTNVLGDNTMDAVDEIPDDDDFDDFLEDEGVSAALAKTPGEGPTAVPFTDVDSLDELEPIDPDGDLDAEAIDELPTYYPEPGEVFPQLGTPPTVQREQPGDEPHLAPIDNDAPTPLPVEARAEGPVSNVPIQKVVPVLIGVMLVLMLLSMLWTMM